MEHVSPDSALVRDWRFVAPRSSADPIAVSETTACALCKRRTHAGTFGAAVDEPIANNGPHVLAVWSVGLVATQPSYVLPGAREEIVTRSAERPSVLCVQICH